MSLQKECLKSLRLYWIDEIEKLSGNFDDDFKKLSEELYKETNNDPMLLISHLRTCGDIPESYHHDSSQEKLYSKYTDALLCQSYNFMGINSSVLTARADTADVESVSIYGSYSFIADAKAFRLSRTAKNQKDFKIQAMDTWRRDKDFAMVVCPIYQLPTTQSQIYQQAIIRNVCLFTYSHLAVLVLFSYLAGKEKADELLHNIFQSVVTLNPTKDAQSYWYSINKTMLDFDIRIKKLWIDEKRILEDTINLSKELALNFLAKERTKILNMTYHEVVNELLKVNKIDSRIRTIESIVTNNLILSLGD